MVRLVLWCIVVKDVHDITKSGFNINQSRSYLQRHLICLTENDNDYTLDEILNREKLNIK